MTRNYPFRFNDESGFEKEKQTFINIMDEACALFGADLVWINQTLNEGEHAFGEFMGKLITEGQHIHLIVDEIEEDFYNDASLVYAKFGIEPNMGAATFHGSIQYFTEHGIDPKPQDLIYYEKTRRMFEVTHVSDEHGFKYVINSVLYDYDHTPVDSDVTDANIRSLEGLDDIDKANNNDQLNAEEQTRYTDPVIDKTDTDGIFGD